MNFPQDLFRKIPDPLLAWFEREKRTLAWRSNPTPYHVWLSEIMLQQTRVEAVKPYYERFLAALPSIAELADAPDDLLLKLWEGLGYYSRVRNLKRAANEIMMRFHGEIPADWQAVRSLPGIGDYTAGAILSIAFGQPCPAVDGNVLRVCSRLAASMADVTKPEVKRELTDVLRIVYPSGRSGEFTQSLMELGALVCVPNGAPECLFCPLRELCGAQRESLTDRIPVKPPKKARLEEQRTILLVRRTGQIALHRRPSKGLLAGLLEFPGLPEPLTKQLVRDLFGECVTFRKGPAAIHIFTHLTWRMQSYYLDLPPEYPDDALPFEPIWVTPDELTEKAALPSAFRVFRTVLTKS